MKWELLSLPQGWASRGLMGVPWPSDSFGLSHLNSRLPSSVTSSSQVAAGVSAMKSKFQAAENRYCCGGRVLGEVTPIKEHFQVRSDTFLSPELSHTPYLAARETGNVVSRTVATPVKISVRLLKSTWEMITDLASVVATLPQVASSLPL